MEDLMAQVGAMQQQLMAAQQELAVTTVEGQAGGGLVKVTGTGDGQVQSVTIDPKVVDPEDVETLQDLVLGALSNLAENTAAVAQQKMGPLAGGLPF
ncbi:MULTISPECIES: YbaB/EbfC family nucleoid-associated protein [unclassified Tsukamurella]|uniref:YbaB/EbfC family nucleoid-associated protein n=1 Tax=Tsukamurella TaxID=2060 RepID=UPI001CCE3B8B|nr:YbaB/EbfC family nucleoid-associated protein [Tsukamurella sp. M9C]MCA0158553.1 YbaB/EbfC family nucleoid-associated protein [Tsukamurella sp. M9C]